MNLLNFIISCMLLENKKLCKDCKYFIADKKKCSKFEDLDIVTGKKVYETAVSLRNNNCGKEGKYFEKNNFKVITEPYYFIKEYYYYIPSFILISLCIDNYINNK